MWKEIDEMNKNTHGHVMPEHRRQRWALRKLSVGCSHSGLFARIKAFRMFRKAFKEQAVGSELETSFALNADQPGRTAPSCRGRRESR